MPAQRGTIGECHPVADMAVVGDVGIGHVEAVVTDACFAAALQRATVHGDILADHVARADDQPCGLVGIAGVLRCASKCRERMDVAVRANGCVSFDNDMRTQPHVVADDGIGANHAEGADVDPVADLGGGIDHRGLVNCRHCGW